MAKLKFTYAKLKGRIIEKFGSQREFAKAVGISECSMTAKLRGHTYFTQPEIFKIIKILDIDPGMVTYYFFTVEVEKPKLKG